MGSRVFLEVYRVICLPMRQRKPKAKQQRTEVMLMLHLQMQTALMEPLAIKLLLMMLNSLILTRLGKRLLTRQE